MVDLWVSLPAASLKGSGCLTGNSECAGLNRHVVGDARALQERK